MREIKVTKMVASGNDFIIVSLTRYPVIPLNKLAQKLCNRKFGLGADGLLVLEKSKIADIRMRIFNADGSEAEMCGNGARCIAFYLGKSKSTLETKTGVIQARVDGDKVKIKLTDPQGIKLDVPIKLNNRSLKVNFIDTGVPHTVIFTSGLENIDIFSLGRLIRYHKKFTPRGTNVDFIEVLDRDSIAIRTYERGVEDETLACGTGVVASAIIFALKSNAPNKINVRTQGKEVLKVYFARHGLKFRDVWLEGKVKIIYKGVYNV